MNCSASLKDSHEISECWCRYFGLSGSWVTQLTPRVLVASRATLVRRPIESTAISRPQQIKKGPVRSLNINLFDNYFLRLIPTKPKRAEPNSQAAAGTGTTLVSRNKK